MKKKELELSVLDSDSYDLLAEICDWKGKKCQSCSEVITGKNFGFIAHKMFYCRSIMCLAKSMEEMDRKGLKFKEEKTKKRKLTWAQ
jgi:hypothetical protein